MESPKRQQSRWSRPVGRDTKPAIMVVCLAVAVLAAGLACGQTPPAESQDDGVVPARTPVDQEQQGVQPTPADYEGPIGGLVFAGKVVNQATGKWVNDRLVLLFLNGQELARTTTVTGEYEQLRIFGPQKRGESSSFGPRLDGGIGIVDGHFVVRVPNTYGLDARNLGQPLSESPFVPVFDDDYGGFWGTKYLLAAWVEPLYEGETRTFFVPSKNATYSLLVLPGPVSDLPAEIQPAGSAALLDGNRLVAVDPSATKATPRSAFSDSATTFETIEEETVELIREVYPVNNCAGTTELKLEISRIYIHEILDETTLRLGVELPLGDWLELLAGIERHYGISDKEVRTIAADLTAAPGQYVVYTIVHQQTWESGVATAHAPVEISAAYRIKKSELLGIVDSELKPCP